MMVVLSSLGTTWRVDKGEKVRVTVTEILEGYKKKKVNKCGG